MDSDTSERRRERTARGPADSDPGTGPLRHWSHDPGQGNINISGLSLALGSDQRGHLRETFVSEFAYHQSSKRRQVLMGEQ